MWGESILWALYETKKDIYCLLNQLGITTAEIIDMAKKQGHAVDQDDPVEKIEIKDDAIKLYLKPQVQSIRVSLIAAISGKWLWALFTGV